MNTRYGADDRTRTCTLARWNLNPMSLPIPPHPHACLFYHGQRPLSIRCNGGYLSQTLWQTVQIISPFALDNSEGTYMNLSGKAVKYWMQQEKIPIENVLVVLDEIALPLGTLPR